MNTLTTNGSGAALDDTTKVIAGRRYIFAWGKDPVAPPTTGTLTPSLQWESTAPLQYLHKPDQTAISYDLSAVASGYVEFFAPESGIFNAAITGGGASKTIYFTLTDITGR